MLKPLVPNFRPDISARLKEIAEKQVSAKLKPLVGVCCQYAQMKDRPFAIHPTMAAG